MTTTDTTPKRRTITLTDRPPVQIREDLWPVLARGWDRHHDGKIECQANRTWKADIIVRRRPSDDRAIVYGVADYETAWQTEPSYTIRAGVLVEGGDAGDLIDHIREVARTIAERMDDEGHDDDRTMRRLLSVAERECVSDLPAEQLDD